MNNINQECSEMERLRLLEELKDLTVDMASSNMYDMMVNSDVLVPNLMQLVNNVKTSYSCRVLALWILSNLACEATVCSKMSSQWNGILVIDSIFKNFFIRDDG